jgi:hypothetical protein
MTDRTSQGLRDALFNEIEGLQNGNVDPRRALAVANVARQIVNTVRVELDYAKEIASIKAKGGDANLGTLVLGTRNLPANGAGDHATVRSSGTSRKERAK